MDKLRISTLNCEGIRRSRDYLNDYLTDASCDILCIQESWHLDENIAFFGTVHTDYLYTAISGVDSRDKILTGRCKGGVGIFYKKSLCSKIKPVTCKNRRICAATINLADNFSCLLLSIYLPCDNYSNAANADYVDCIDCIESLLISEHCNAFICCGDYNTSFERNNAQTECLNNFIERNNLVVSWNHPVSKKDHTYTNFSLNHFSCIDHIITTHNIYDCILDNYVLSAACNPSSHNVVSLSIVVTNFSHVIESNCNPARTPNCIWSKASIDDIKQYQLVLDNKLQLIDINNSAYSCTNWNCQCTQHKDGLDSLCQTLIDYCIDASRDTIPKSRPVGSNIPGWEKLVKPDRDRSLFWHWMWQEAGKPQHGLVYSIMKRTRHQYHYAVRCCKSRKLELHKQKIADNVSNGTVFWKELSKLNPTNKVSSNQIDDASGSIEISKLFHDKYRLLYSSVPTDTEELDDLHNDINNGITPNDHVMITPAIIRQCVSRLKSGKGDGDIGFRSDHLINGSQRLFIILSLLFNSMLVHGYTPDALLKSTIISIPKDSAASLTRSDNYRGISLFNSICKLFDHVILLLFGGQLEASDMQFGFKRGHSTVMCSLIFKEIVDHYLHHGSNVYSCLLDASKAFDRVHYGTLFRLLLKKDVPRCVIRLVFDSYIRQKACATWNKQMSEYFTMENGVKQGGVISPIFFSIYIDPLLLQLRNSGYGCHLNGVYMGALSYADDITLTAPSIGGLNEMLKLCDNYATVYNVIFNSKKTVCIKFGNEVIRNEAAFLNNQPLKWNEKVRHLGNIIDKDCTELADCVFKKSMFIGYVNKLRSNFRHLQTHVLITLFKAYCCSFYGSQLWKFNSVGIDKCCKSWNIAVRTLLGLPYNAHTYLLGPIMGQLDLRSQLYIRNFRFLWHAFRSDNNIIYTCINNALCNSNSGLGYKLAFYRYRYNITMTDDFELCIARISQCDLSDHQLAIVNNLSLLISVREGDHLLLGFTSYEIAELINELATM